MSFNCPHCNELIPSPTPQQIRAYYLTEILGEPQERAAILLGISQPAVSKLLERLQKLRPDLFGASEGSPFAWDKLIPFHSVDESKVKHSF